MRRLALLLALAAAPAAWAQFRGSIEVVRVLVDARVTDYDGNPVPDLKAEDFVVTIGGKDAFVESAEFVEDRQSCLSCEQNGQARQPALHVIYVQTDHDRRSFRLRGQINFLRKIEEMIATMPATDRFAVFQFDSHLKFRLDFTSDRTAVRAALQETIRTNIPPPPESGDPALTPYLDRAAMKRAWSNEKALLVVGSALAHLPGPKSMILLGWGMGIPSPTGAVYMRWRTYEAARRALEEARTAVFALDVAWADAHTLAAGLKKLAIDTGGYYASTFRLPDLAVRRLEKTLGGHYELTLIRPADLPRGKHALRIGVKRRGVYAFAQSTFTDKP